MLIVFYIGVAYVELWKNLRIKPVLQRSPQSKQVSTLSLPNGASVRRSLFSDETSSMANIVNLNLLVSFIYGIFNREFTIFVTF